MKLLLIDKNINYVPIISAKKSDVDYILFNPLVDTYNSIKYRIAEKRKTYTDIAIVQHYDLTSEYIFLLKEGPLKLDEAAPYNSYEKFRKWLIEIKQLVRVKRIDLLACALYYHVNFRGALAWLEQETGIDLRASTNFTGNPEQGEGTEGGADWVMESDNIDIRENYFTDAISEFKELLFIAAYNGYQYSDYLDSDVGFVDADNIMHHYTYGSVTVTPLDTSFNKIYSNGSSFVGRTSANQFYIWGISGEGGNSSPYASLLRIDNPTTGTPLSTADISNVISTPTAHAALRTNGNIYIWGKSLAGGNGQNCCSFLRINNASSGAILGNMTNIYATDKAFVAINENANNSIYIWGATGEGGNGQNYCTLLTGNPANNIFKPVSVKSTNTAFAVLNNGGQVFIWGKSAEGGNALNTYDKLAIDSMTGTYLSNVASIYATNTAFAALTTTGDVYIWGASGQGGNGQNYCSRLRIDNATTGTFLTNIKAIYSTATAFAAVNTSNNVYIWGSGSGGNGNRNHCSVLRIDNATTGSLLGSVANIYSTSAAFVAVTTTKIPYVWGGSFYGGNGQIYCTRLRENNETTGTLITNIENVHPGLLAFFAVATGNIYYYWGSTGLYNFRSTAYAFRPRINDATNGSYLTNLAIIKFAPSAISVTDTSNNVYTMGTFTNGGNGFNYFTKLNVSGILSIQSTDRAFAVTTATNTYVYGNSGQGGLYGRTYSQLNNIKSITSANAKYLYVDLSLNAWYNVAGSIVQNNQMYPFQLRIDNSGTGQFLSNVSQVYVADDAFALVDLSKNIYNYGTGLVGGNGTTDYCTQLRLTNSTGSALTGIEKVYNTLTAFAAINSLGIVYIWGASLQGGNGSNFASFLRFSNVTTGSIMANIEQIFATKTAFAAIIRGQVYIWGASGQGGNGQNHCSYLRINNADNGNALSSIDTIVSTGSAFAAIDLSKNAWIWGESAAGGNGENFCSALRIDNSGTGVPLSNISKIYGNDAAFAALTTQGQVYIWGANRQGGNDQNHCSLLRINATSGTPLSNVTDIYATLTAFVAIDTSKNAWIWGASAAGGNGQNFCSALRINNATTGTILSNIIRVGATNGAFAAIDASRNVYYWGTALQGGNGQNYASLQEIPNAKRLYSRSNSFFLLDMSTNLYSWGGNTIEYVRVFKVFTPEQLSLSMQYDVSLNLTDGPNLGEIIISTIPADIEGTEFNIYTKSVSTFALIGKSSNSQFIDGFASQRSNEYYITSASSNVYIKGITAGSLTPRSPSFSISTINFQPVLSINAYNARYFIYRNNEQINQTPLYSSTFTDLSANKYKINKYYIYALTNSEGPFFTPILNYALISPYKLYKRKKDICGNFIDIYKDICGNSLNRRHDSSDNDIRYPASNIITWGSVDSGADSSAMADQLTSNVVSMYANEFGFAALTSNNKIISWGGNISPGEKASDVLLVTSTLGAFAALKSDGSVVAWGESAAGAAAPSLTAVTAIYSTASAFAALKSDGSVATWGEATAGGNSSVVAAQLTSGVVAIYSTYYAFAALKTDGSVVTWGEESYGGNSSNIASNLTNVFTIFSSTGAFVALKRDGSVVAWGDAAAGGTAPSLTLVTTIYSTTTAFAALRTDGSVVTWGSASSGGDSSQVAAELTSGVVAIYSTNSAFAALKTNGSIVAWGDATAGGNLTTQVTGVKAIYSTATAFAALTSTNSVLAWGDPSGGGNTSSVSSQLTNVLSIFSTGTAFTALKSDGSLVTWGSLSSPSAQTNIITIYSSGSAFAALKPAETIKSSNYYFPSGGYRFYIPTSATKSIYLPTIDISDSTALKVENIQNGIPPYSYEWSNSINNAQYNSIASATNTSLTITNNGEYARTSDVYFKLKISDSNENEYEIEPFIVTYLSKITGQLVATNPVAKLNEQVVVSALVQGGTSNYLYEWYQINEDGTETLLNGEESPDFYIQGPDLILINNAQYFNNTKVTYRCVVKNLPDSG